MSKASSTPEQLADWLGRCTDAERLRFAARALDAFERASRCFEFDHEYLVEKLRPNVL